MRLIHAQSKQDKSDTKRVLLSQGKAEKTERKLLFYLCEGRQNNLFTPECVLCSESFPSIVLMCYLNHQIDMKRSFHVLLPPEGLGELAFHSLCLSQVIKPFVILSCV